MQLGGVSIPDVLYTEKGRALSTAKIVSYIRRKLREDFMVLADMQFQVAMFIPWYNDVKRKTLNFDLTPKGLYMILCVYTYYLMTGQKRFSTKSLCEKIPLKPTAARKYLKEMLKIGLFTRKGSGIYEMNGTFFSYVNTIKFSASNVLQWYSDTLHSGVKFPGLRELIPNKY